MQFIGSTVCSLTIPGILRKSQMTYELGDLGHVYEGFLKDDGRGEGRVRQSCSRKYEILDIFVVS